MSEDWQALIGFAVAPVVTIAFFVLVPLLMRSGFPVFERAVLRMSKVLEGFLSWYLHLWSPKSSSDKETSISATVRPPPAKAEVSERLLAAWALGTASRTAEPNIRVALDSLLKDPKTSSQMQAQIEKALERIDQLEHRFPAATEVDKYADVNDALLDAGLKSVRDRLDALEASVDKRLEAIDEKMMTPWKVFGVVVVTLTILLALAGAYLAVATYVIDDGPQPAPSPTRTASPAPSD